MHINKPLSNKYLLFTFFVGLASLLYSKNTKIPLEDSLTDRIALFNSLSKEITKSIISDNEKSNNDTLESISINENYSDEDVENKFKKHKFINRFALNNAFSNDVIKEQINYNALKNAVKDYDSEPYKQQIGEEEDAKDNLLPYPAVEPDIQLTHPAWLAFTQPDLAVKVIGVVIDYKTTFESADTQNVYSTGGRAFIPFFTGLVKPTRWLTLGLEVRGEGALVNWGRRWEHAEIIEFAEEINYFITANGSIKIAPWLSVGGSYTRIIGGIVNEIQLTSEIESFIPGGFLGDLLSFLGSDNGPLGDIASNVLTQAIERLIPPFVDITPEFTDESGNGSYVNGEEQAVIAGLGKGTGDNYRLSIVLKPTPRTDFLTIGVTYLPKTTIELEGGDAQFNNISQSVDNLLALALEGKQNGLSILGVIPIPGTQALLDGLLDLEGDPFSGDRFRTVRKQKGSIIGDVWFKFNRRFTLLTQFSAFLSDVNLDTDILIYNQNEPDRVLFTFVNRGRGRKLSYGGMIGVNYLLTDNIQARFKGFYVQGAPPEGISPTDPIVDRITTNIGVTWRTGNFLLAFEGVYNKIIPTVTTNENYRGRALGEAIIIGGSIGYNLNLRKRY